MTAPGGPRLLGDVGATHARWGWQAAPGQAIESVRSYRCADFGSLQAVLERYFADTGAARPCRVAFGIATALTGDTVVMTNLAWTFSIVALQAALGAERLLVLNDFAAFAGALPRLAPHDLRRVGGGAALAGAPMAVLGPGSGLGVAGLLRGEGAGARDRMIAGEGGHATLAAGNPREAAVIEHLRAGFGHASAERALSGPGLVNLYRAICTLDGRATERLAPADVTARALAESDAACVEALDLFCALLGSVAGNLALTFGARGGVYIAGGIVPRLGSAFDASPFRARFEAKGRFRDWLAGIPTQVVVSTSAALLGAAEALDRQPD